MDFKEFKQKLKAKFSDFIESVSEYSEQIATAIIASRILALIGVAVTLGIGLGTMNWLGAMTGLVIIMLAFMLHGYRNREGF